MSTAMATQAQKPTTGYAPVNGLEMYYEMRQPQRRTVGLAARFVHDNLEQLAKVDRRTLESPHSHRRRNEIAETIKLGLKNAATLGTRSRPRLTRPFHARTCANPRTS